MALDPPQPVNGHEKFPPAGVTVIQSWLGHVHIDTTFPYAQANVETKRKAIEQVDGEARATRWKQEPALLRWLDSL